MGYQMAATAVTLNDLEGHSQVVGLFKCNPSNSCAALYTISTDSMQWRIQGGHGPPRWRPEKNFLPVY